MPIRLQLPAFWYHRHWLAYLLLPFSWLYQAASALRRGYYRFASRPKLPVPVIVIGNLTLGGAGKTPLVIALANRLQAQHYQVGIISRGYGRTTVGPQIVSAQSTAQEVGDEPLLIFKQTGALVVVANDRYAAATMASQRGCNIILSDDGLQHYNLPRDLEILVIDQSFQFGNGFCLPAGPLREPPARSKTVDFIVTNFSSDHAAYLRHPSYKFYLTIDKLYNVLHPEWSAPLTYFQSKTISAVAGISRPQKFFETLRTLKLEFSEHPFPDHHPFSPQDLALPSEIILLTEKDSMRCAKELLKENFWSLSFTVHLDENFMESLLQRLKAI